MSEANRRVDDIRKLKTAIRLLGQTVNNIEYFHTFEHTEPTEKLSMFTAVDLIECVLGNYEGIEGGVMSQSDNSCPECGKLTDSDEEYEGLCLACFINQSEFLLGGHQYDEE